MFWDAKTLAENQLSPERGLAAQNVILKSQT